MMPTLQDRAIQQPIHRVDLKLRAVWLMLPARWAFAALIFILGVLVAKLLSQPDPIAAAGSWWMVDGTLVDLGCLAALVTLTRREGIGLLDLLNIHRSRIARDVVTGLALVLTLIPALAVNQILQTVFYPGQMPPQIALVHLPAWASLYSVVVWPAIWAATEQATYLGYLFPRLEMRTRSTLLAAVLVIAFWSLQHTALPFVVDAHYLAYRVLTTVPIATTAVVLYLFVLQRRLVALVVVHWIADVLAAMSPVLLVQQ